VSGVIKKLGEERYYIAVRIPTSAGPATQLKRSGFTRRKDAQAALDRIAELLAVPKPNDDITRAHIGDQIVSSTRRGGRLPDVVEMRHRYGAGLDPTAATPTVGAYLDEWVAGRRKIRETTRAAHRGCINVYLRPHLGDIPLDALRKAHIDRMVNWIIASGRLSPASLYQVVAVLRAALNTAIKEQLISFNPVVQVELPEIPQTERPVWTPAQALQFLEYACEDRYVAAYRIVLLGGLRRGEVCALRWSDINWDTGKIRVERGLVYLAGELTEQPTKTGRTRVVALDAETVEALRQHRKAQAADRLAAANAWHDGDYIFARADGSPVQPKTLSYRFQVLAREAGLPEIRLHDGRHMSATWGLIAGENILVTSKRLGHARPQITQQLYQHVLDGMQEQAAERRAALLTRPGAGSR
jgi:integrase